MKKRTRLVTLRISQKTFTLLRTLPWGSKSKVVDLKMSKETTESLLKLLRDTKNKRAA